MTVEVLGRVEIIVWDYAKILNKRKTYREAQGEACRVDPLPFSIDSALKTYSYFFWSIVEPNKDLTWNTASTFEVIGSQPCWASWDIFFKKSSTNQNKVWSMWIFNECIKEYYILTSQLLGTKTEAKGMRVAISSSLRDYCHYCIETLFLWNFL